MSCNVFETSLRFYNNKQQYLHLQNRRESTLYEIYTANLLIVFPKSKIVNEAYGKGNTAPNIILLYGTLLYTEFINIINVHSMHLCSHSQAIHYQLTVAVTSRINAYAIY